ncbi:MAG: LTA synthase family protein [Wujia sp.]
MKEKLRNIIQYFFGSIFLAVACLIPIAVIYCFRTYGQLEIGFLLFMATSPLEGSNMEPFIKLIILAVLVITGACVFGIILAKRSNIPGKLVIQFGKCRIRFAFSLFHRFYALWMGILMLLSAAICVKVMKIDDYIRHQLETTTFFEDYYINPETVTLTFPEEKRNLIYIVLESMEITYADPEHGGNEYANFIPNLIALQEENIGFTTQKDKLNGAICTNGSEWTFGALVAQTSGIPVLLPSSKAVNDMGQFDDCLPGAYSIGQILENQGYTQEFFIGSDATFGGRNKYFKQHGNYKIRDYYYARKHEWIPHDYYEFWGYEDCKLYEFAKEEITALAAEDAPFNFTMLTVDTHFFNGYKCELCEDKFDNQYANVIACADRQLYDFINWMKEQPFYENTTIVICGDHPTMDDAYMQSTCVSPDYQRKVYTCVIHPATTYHAEQDRVFTTMDLFPTTLGAMGVSIEGNRLGYGTNLFSDTPTLVEELGLEKLNEEFSKNSIAYKEKVLQGK